MRKKVSCDSCHKKRKDKSDSKRHTISQFLNIVASIFLSNFTIVIRLGIEVITLCRYIATHYAILMLIFKFLYHFSLFRSSLAELNHTIHVDIWDDVVLRDIFVKIFWRLNFYFFEICIFDVGCALDCKHLNWIKISLWNWMLVRAIYAYVDHLCLLTLLSDKNINSHKIFNLNPEYYIEKIFRWQICNLSLPNIIRKFTKKSC